MTERRGAVAHLWNDHLFKTTMLGSGVFWFAAGLSISSIVTVLVGVVLASLGLGQLIAYWRHDHTDCDHPACSAIGDD